MAKLWSGVSLGCVVLFGVLSRGMAHGTEIAQSTEQAMARTAPSPNCDLQQEFGSSFSVNPVYHTTDPRGTVRLVDDGIQRERVDLSFKGSLPAGLKGEGQFASSSANSQTEEWFRQTTERRLQNAGEARPVRIGRNAWIGFEAVILPGVTIGEGAVIGARSVVVEPVPPFTVVAGNPARVVRVFE